jgi:FkbM family methyltransferase
MQKAARKYRIRDAIPDKKPNYAGRVLITKRITLLGEALDLVGDDHDLYFCSFPAATELADSVITGVLPLLAESAQSPVCLDVGANLGLYSIAVARRLPQATVIAFEPVPATYAALCQNVAANAPGCTTLELALGSAARTELITVAHHYAAGSHLSSAGSLATHEGAGYVEIDVEVATLDAVVAEQKLPRVDLIKIDVEGYETDVLAGATATLAEHTPIVQLEFNSWAFTAHRKLLPQDALEQIMTAFPYVYVHDRHSDRFGRVRTDGDRLQLLRANMIHGCVDNLLCGFGELVSQAPDYAGVWQEFSATPDSQLAPLHDHIDTLIERIEAQNSHIEGQNVHIVAQDGLIAELRATLRERDAIYDTLSWRATKPLRALRALKH